MSTDTEIDIDTIPRLDGVEHVFVDLPDGLRMHVALAGAGDPVLLLHGFPQHWWEWRGVIPALARQYRVVAPDLRGAGWTDAPASGYDSEQQVADVLALLDRLDLGRVRIVAHDHGALVAYRLCYDHPERVAAFLCLGPHPYLAFDPHLLAALPHLWFQPVVATPGLGSWALRRTGLTTHLLRGGSAHADAFTDDDLRIFADRLQADARAGAGSAMYRRCILPEMRRFMGGTYRRRRLTVPTVALQGAEEPGVRPGAMDVHGDVADDLTGELVPGAAHFIADDRPDVVVDEALRLFARAG